MKQKKTQEEFYRDFEKQASPEDIKKIDDKLGGMNKGPIKELWCDIQILYKLIKDPYRAWGSKAAIVASLLYLISPIDAIPDIIAIFGLTDDATVIAFTVRRFRNDIDNYKRAHNI